MKLLTINWHEVGIVSIRAFLSLLLLFFVAKLIGKKQVSELNLFDYVISITIGNFAAEISMNLDNEFINAVFAVLVFAFVSVLINYIAMKSIALRKFLIGEPNIIIYNGKFNYDNMKKVKLDINDFLESARIAGYFDISEIKYALMEANGKVSFMAYEENQNVTLSDMKLSKEKKDLLINLIIDGKIIDKNLKKIGKTRSWLKDKIKSEGKYKIENILLLTAGEKDKINIFNK